MRPLLTGEGEWPRQEVFVEYFEDAPLPFIPSSVCLRTAGAKLIHYLRDGETDEFYDLVRDPDERTNVTKKDRHAGQVGALRDRLVQAQSRYGYQVPDLTPKNFYGPAPRAKK